MKHQPEIAFDADGDALADAAEFADGAAFGAVSGGSTVRSRKTLSAGARAPASGQGCAASSAVM